MKIQEKIPQHLRDVAEKLDIQIKTLNDGDDISSVFDQDEQSAIQMLGTEKYLAMLKSTRYNLGQPEDLSGD